MTSGREVNKLKYAGRKRRKRLVHFNVEFLSMNETFVRSRQLRKFRLFRIFSTRGNFRIRKVYAKQSQSIFPLKSSIFAPLLIKTLLMFLKNVFLHFYASGHAQLRIAVGKNPSIPLGAEALHQPSSAQV